MTTKVHALTDARGLPIRIVLTPGQAHDLIGADALLSTLGDGDILRQAVAESRLVITMDKDFGELVHRVGAGHAGVLLLRLDEATGPEKRMSCATCSKSTPTQSPGAFPSTTPVALEFVGPRGWASVPVNASCA